jgi:predicted DNA-binding transcriptional regulator AlpA
MGKHSASNTIVEDPRPTRTGRRTHGGSSQPASMATPDTHDPLLTAAGAADELGLSLSAFWRGVTAERLPKPVYPMPRAPRWRRSELRASLEATRALPAEAKAMRRAARLAATNTSSKNARSRRPGPPNCGSTECRPTAST